MDFFPNPIFGWCYFLALLAFLAAASLFDYRFLVIPKKITIACGLLGVGFNLARGFALAFGEHRVWFFDSPGPILGAVDGLLFSLAGMATLFGLFMAMFALGVCRGGDVKLLAAVGAWTGPRHALYVMLAASLVLIILSFAWLVLSTFRYGPGHVSRAYSQQQARKGMQRPARAKHRLMSYSFPVAVAVLIVMGWIWARELNIPVPRSGDSAGAVRSGQS